MHNSATPPTPARAGWIYDPALACGGPIGDVGIHCIDALRFVLDSRVAAVGTLARADAASAPLEAYASISLDFSTGAMGAVTVSTRGAYRSLVEVTGETGAIVSQFAMTVENDVDVEVGLADRSPSARPSQTATATPACLTRSPIGWRDTGPTVPPARTACITSRFWTPPTPVGGPESAKNCPRFSAFSGSL